MSGEAAPAEPHLLDFNKPFAFSMLPWRSPSLGANWRVAIFILQEIDFEKHLILGLAEVLGYVESEMCASEINGLNAV